MNALVVMLHVFAISYKLTKLLYIIRAGKRFKGSNLCSFAAHSKLNVYLQSFTATPILMFAHVHFYNLNVWLTMWVCSRNVEAQLLAAFVLFLSSAMPNLDRHTDRNNTSTCYKAIMRLSIANQGKSNIDKNMCEPSFIFADEVSKAVFQPSSQPYSK